MKSKNLKFILSIVAAAIGMNVQPVFGVIEPKVQRAIDDLTKNSIQKLDLRDCHLALRPEEIMLLVEALKINNSVNDVLLNSNSLNDEEVKMIVNVLPKNLIRLCLANNSIEKAGIRAICDAFAGDDAKIQMLDFRCNFLGFKGLKEIVHFFFQKPTLKILVLCNWSLDEGNIEEMFESKGWHSYPLKDYFNFLRGKFFHRESFKKKLSQLRIEWLQEKLLRLQEKKPRIGKFNIQMQPPCKNFRQRKKCCTGEAKLRHFLGLVLIF